MRFVARLLPLPPCRHSHLLPTTTLLPQQLNPAAITPGPSDSSPSDAPTATSASGEADPFPDVQLGLLLGKGTYGRVYRGAWAYRGFSGFHSPCPDSHRVALHTQNSSSEPPATCQ